MGARQDCEGGSDACFFGSSAEFVAIIMSVAKEIEHSFSILGMMVFAKDHLTWREKLCFLRQY
jgi:hypothetical protein